MRRYINAERLENDILYRIDASYIGAEDTHFNWAEARARQDELHKILSLIRKKDDAIELVRCEECKHYINRQCGHFDGLCEPKPDDFCSYGEWSGDSIANHIIEHWNNPVKHTHEIDEYNRTHWRQD